MVKKNLEAISNFFRVQSRFDDSCDTRDKLNLGFQPMDYLKNGVKKGSLNIVNIGDQKFCDFFTANLISANARNDRVVTTFSLRRNKDEVLGSLMAVESKWPFGSSEKEKLTHQKSEMIVKAARTIRDYSNCVVIDDKSKKMDDILYEIGEWTKTKHIDLVIIDGIEKIYGVPEGGKSFQKVILGLRKVCETLDLPVIVFCGNPLLSSPIASGVLRDFDNRIDVNYQNYKNKEISDFYNCIITEAGEKSIAFKWNKKTAEMVI